MRKSIWRWFIEASLVEKAAIGVSILLAAFIIVDPLTVNLPDGLAPSLRQFFRHITDIGKSGWILFPSGLAAIVFYILWQGSHARRFVAAYGYLMSVASFIFASVAGSGLVASLTKNIIGRARPKHFDTLGPTTFEPFAFRSDFASFPSGHATTALALAACVACVWPRARVAAFTLGAWIAATRFFVGAHYVSDVVAGAILGAGFTYVVRAWFAANGWLFRQDAKGQIRLRAPRLRRWMGAKIRAFVMGRDKMAGVAGFSGHS